MAGKDQTPANELKLDSEAPPSKRRKLFSKFLKRPTNPSAARRNDKTTTQDPHEDINDSPENPNPGLPTRRQILVFGTGVVVTGVLSNLWRFQRPTLSTPNPEAKPPQPAEAKPSPSPEISRHKEIVPEEARKIAGYIVAGFVNPGISDYQLESRYLWTENKPMPPAPKANPRIKTYSSFEDFYQNIYPQNDQYQKDIIKAIWEESPDLMEKLTAEAIIFANQGAAQNKADPREYLVTFGHIFFQNFRENRHKHGYASDSSPEAFRRGSLLDPITIYGRDLVKDPNNPNQLTQPPGGFMVTADRYRIGNVIQTKIAHALNPDLERKHTKEYASDGILEEDTKQALKDLEKSLGTVNYQLLIDDMQARFSNDIRKFNVGIAVHNQEGKVVIPGSFQTFKGLKIDNETISQWHSARNILLPVNSTRI